MNLEVSSEAFANDGCIPVQYTGRGKEISPPLQFKSVVSEAETIAIIMDDTALPLVTITHWLIWNIPARFGGIPADIPREAVVASLDGARQGRNIYGRIGYLGPKPPFGTHTYRFQVYALDTYLELEPGARKKALQEAMKGHILQRGLLRGLFGGTGRFR
jgi:Raf kinase inhibitor-like YbhB/YbcL family protein